MTQLKEMLEKEDLDHLLEVKNDLDEDYNVEKSGKGNKVWVWIAALIVAIVVFK